MELTRPGATLYYEERGAGPLLLMICGGPTDAGVFAGAARLLAPNYRVVTYDPRGNSRSVASGEPQDQAMDVHGDDAAALLASFGDEPAFVFGNSGGAQIGLNLTARYGARVRTLIAHEPPCMALLPDSAEWAEKMGGVIATYRGAGPGAAMAQFMQIAGIKATPKPLPDAPAPPPELGQTFARIGANLPFFFEHGMGPLSAYTPDVAALRAGPARVVVGAGEETVGTSPHQAALALAAAFGAPAVLFPGDHGGYGGPTAAAFAQRVHAIFSGPPG